MLIAENISYTHPDRTVLFTNLNFSIAPRTKVALVGNNGSGKSTILRLVANELALSSGRIAVESKPYYVPQLLGQHNHRSIAAVLGVEKKLQAYYRILDGKATVEDLTLLDDDWGIEERCVKALDYWGLQQVDLFDPIENHSGGEKTKIFLAGIQIQQPRFILLDEPSNHLDSASRQQLYHFVKSTSSTLFVVSHDRQLLDLMNQTLALTASGIASFGGNYSFYAEQQDLSFTALEQSIQHKEKELRKAKEREKETLERQQRLDSRGKKKQEQAGVSRIMINTLRNSAEKSTSKTQAVHSGKIDGIRNELSELRMTRQDTSKIRFGFADSALHRGKVLLDAQHINVQYNNVDMWPSALSVQIRSGDRILLKGGNGTGKTTLIHLLLGSTLPDHGRVLRQIAHATYIDQDYSLLDDSLTIYEQAQSANNANIEEHQVNMRLDQFLFSKDSWSKKIDVLSGGEKMRLALCCLTLENTTPELIVLDEPTNNLDIQSVEILTRAVSEYQGTLIVVSHDQTFTQEIDINREIILPEKKQK